MPEWTKEQSAAIYSRNKELLVSAAAGSGKTAVLVQRILSLIEKDKCQIDRMLVVTFTRAAAAEMKERIIIQMQEASQRDLHVRQQLLKIERANISTLHVFCGQVIHDYFQIAQIDPTARICEGGERNKLFQEAIDITLKGAYEESSEAFLKLAEAFNEKEIIAMLEDIYTFLMAQAKPWEWLEKSIEAYPDSNNQMLLHPWMQTLCYDLAMQCEGSLYISKENLAYCEQISAIPQCSETALNDLNQTKALYKALMEAPENLAKLAAQWQFQRLNAPKKKSQEQENWYEAYKEKRESWKDSIKGILKQMPPDISNMVHDIQATTAMARGLAQLAKDLWLIFSEIKKARNVYDFHDLEHKTLLVLQVPETKREIQEKYDAIFIDEYQDISGIQEAIIQGIHKENMLFLVGDVKQSIYRFRLADPGLFLEKYKQYKDDEEAQSRRIDLQNNFRSSKTILDGVNRVFENTMQESVTEIDYDEKARLIAGSAAKYSDINSKSDSKIESKRDSSSEQSQDFPIDLYIFRPKEKGEKEPEKTAHVSESVSENKAITETETEIEALGDAIEKEAHVMAKGFIAMYHKTIIEKGKERRIGWRDMALLLPKAQGVARRAAQVLRDEGIPVYSDADEQYFALPEIITTINLLKIIDNPMQDIPLLSVLGSQIFGLGDEQLSEIRLINQGRNVPFYQCFFEYSKLDTPLGKQCNKILQSINEWQFSARMLPLDKFIWQLLSQTGIYVQAGALPSGEVRQANLRLLCQRCSEYIKTSHNDLHGFLELGENMRASGDSTTAATLGENEDVLRIMTIHKSKGLEFPVVGIMGLGGGLHSNKKRRSRVYLHNELGLAMPYINSELRIYRSTIGQQAIALRQRKEEKAERARLLYVGMTRAREKLILAGSIANEKQAKTWTHGGTPYGIWQAHSMLDWISQALCAGSYKAQINEAFNIKNDPDKQASTAYPQEQEHWRIRVLPFERERPVEKAKDIHSMVEALLNRRNTAHYFEQNSKGQAQEIAFTDQDDSIDGLRFVDGERQIKSNTPLKTSVTSIVKKNIWPMNLEHIEQETEDIKAQSEEIVMPLKLSELPTMPLFLRDNNQKESVRGADIGTATHKALGLMPLEKIKGLQGEALREAIGDCINQMQEEDIITKEQREGIKLPWLYAFYKSDMGQRMLASPSIHREWPFIYQYGTHGETLVQGIIDCCFTEKNNHDSEEGFVLLDYKTDIVRDTQAIKIRYEGQLSLYKKALMAITKKPVFESAIYLLRTGDIIKL